MYFAAVSLWLSFLAKCKTFNVLCVDRGNIFNGKSKCCQTDVHDIRIQNYATDTEEYLFLSSIIF